MGWPGAGLCPVPSAPSTITTWCCNRSMKRRTLIWRLLTSAPRVIVMVMWYAYGPMNCDTHGIIPQPDTAERHSLSFRVTTENTILTGTSKWFQFGNKAKVHDYVWHNNIILFIFKMFQFSKEDLLSRHRVNSLECWDGTSTALDLHNGPAWLSSLVRRLLRAVAVTAIKVFVAWPILSTIGQSWTFVSSSSLLLWHVL